jgi:hypothetical protein
MKLFIMQFSRTSCHFNSAAYILSNQNIDDKTDHKMENNYAKSAKIMFLRLFFLVFVHCPVCL